MFSYFCIYSIFGFFMESTYISILKRKLFASGLLDGPYIPLYGIGASILILFSPILNQSIWLCFFLGSFFMTTLEYLTSIYIEKIFHKKCWNYQNHFMNLQGRICLLYSFIWGILSVILIHLIIPNITFKPTIITEIISMIIICIIIKDTLKQKRIVN